jgi:hypothetical protein
MNAGRTVAGFVGGSEGRRLFDDRAGDLAATPPAKPTIPAPEGLWIRAKIALRGPERVVQAPDGRHLHVRDVVLIHSDGTRTTVSRQNDPTLLELLAQHEGHALEVDVKGSRVLGILAQNDSKKSILVWDGTDDRPTDASHAAEVIAKHNLFEITGTVTAEKEAGGGLFYETPKGEIPSTTPGIVRSLAH